MTFLLDKKNGRVTSESIILTVNNVGVLGLVDTRPVATGLANVVRTVIDGTSNETSPFRQPQ